MVSDVDGTIYKGSLLLDFYKYLSEVGYVEKSDNLNAWIKDKKNDLLIKLTAEEFREKVTGQCKNDLSTKAKEFVGTISKDKLYSLPVDLINKAKQEDRVVILLSGSPKMLVRPFAKMLGVKSYATIFETCEDNKFNGDVQPMWACENKNSIIKNYIMKKGFYTLEDSIGLGDVYGGDKGIWENTTHNYIINPSRQNLELALLNIPNIKVFY